MSVTVTIAIAVANKDTDAYTVTESVTFRDADAVADDAVQLEFIY
jgi:hypothetical protein